ncbi:hypothetical protein A2U01_0032533, partial [Trifolium medium]|nr:hypothetical protein [Trifolium medium]
MPNFCESPQATGLVFAIEPS